MKTRIFLYIMLAAFSIISAGSCVQEYTVLDNSFEFEAVVTYDDTADEHRLTLTRKSGMDDNEYRISFTLDGESALVLTDMNGTRYE